MSAYLAVAAGESRSDITCASRPCTGAPRCDSMPCAAATALTACCSFVPQMTARARPASTARWIWSGSARGSALVQSRERPRSVGSLPQSWRALCMAGECSPRARVAPHTGAVVQTFVRLSQEGGSMVRDVARSAFRAHGDVLHATCSCTPYTLCSREIVRDHTSRARRDEPTSAAPCYPCDVLWVW